MAHRSHCRRVHDAIIHNETINTNNTVPGHIVINVFKTNLEKNLMKKGSKNNFSCSTIFRYLIENNIKS